MISYLERLQKELDGAVGDLSAGDWSRAPAGKWSAAQILEHLLLTYKGTNRGLERCLAQGTPSVTRPTLKDRFAVLLVVKVGYMPPGRKAPERTIPQGLSPEEVRKAIPSEIRAMRLGLDDCERRFGPGTKIMDHPILGPLTAEEWCKFHWVHARHHARQIRERMGKS